MADQRIVLDADALRLVLPINHSDKLQAYVLLDELQIALDILVGELQAVRLEVAFELAQDGVVNLEVVRDGLVDTEVGLAEIEERTMTQELLLDRVRLGVGDLDVGGDPTAAINLTPPVG